MLVNNAGIMPLSPLHGVKVDEWNRMIDVNIRGVLHGIAAVLPGMQARKSGHIINLSSIGGHQVWADCAVYCGTKFAVLAISAQSAAKISLKVALGRMAAEALASSGR